MTSKNTTTPADVAAKAVEENLVTNMPEQNNGVKKNPDTVTEEQTAPKLTVVEGGKKSLKERLNDLVNLARTNKATVGGFVLGAGVGALGYARFVANKAIQMSVEDEEALRQAKADAESVADMG
jgi:hypothetical protein